MSSTITLSKPRLFNFQDKYFKEVVKKIYEEGLPAVLKIADTGTGKTYMIAAVLDYLFNETDWFDRFPPTLCKVFYVTKATVVTQTIRVLRDGFGLNVNADFPVGDIFVTNYDQLRASLGELFIEDRTEIIRGEPIIKFIWKENVTPILFIWDECHALMNESSQQSKIAQALNDLPKERLANVYQIFMSATPFGRISEAKCFSVATRTNYKFGFISSPLTNKHWLDFAMDLSQPDKPSEFSPKACQRLMDRLASYITRVKNVRPKFHARNGVKLIDFQTVEERLLYQKAFDEYQEELLKARGYQLEGISAVLVAIKKFQQAAELIRARYLALSIIEIVKSGKAGVIACQFRATVARITEILVNEFSISRTSISLIWGGIDDYMDLKEEYHNLELGSQSRVARQREIDKFQTGKSLYCIFTCASGGVGLSLHHSKLELRPRELLATPTYNAKELVQVLGRCPRLTSLSDTIQTIIYYRGTIEESVAERVGVKLKCLKEMVASRETFMDVFTDGVKELVQKSETIEDIEREREREEMAEIYIEDDNEEGEVIDI